MRRLDGSESGAEEFVGSLYKKTSTQCLLGVVHTEGPHPERWAAELYDACAAQLVLYGRALGLSHPESEDVLQDTFRALLCLGEAPREPRYYAIRSFRNRALNHRRGLWRRLLREVEASRWFERDPANSPVEQAAVAALSRLPTEQREVIVLKIWNDLTFEKIAELLELSPNTAAGRYRYGIQKLRVELQDRQLLESLETHDHEYLGPVGNPAPWLRSPDPVPEA